MSREWFPRGEWRRLKKAQMELERAAAARAGRSLVTDAERATLPPDHLRQLAHCRWMELRFTGRVTALDGQEGRG